MRKLRMNELNRLSPAEFKNAAKFPLCVVLDNVRSVLNVGSVFRTCDAFLVHKLYLCGITPTPENREMRKTALGGTESVAWEYHVNTVDIISVLKEEGFKVLAIEQTTHSLPLKRSFDITGKTAFVFGNEVKGISQEVLRMCNGFIEIPQFGTKHSLNISVSAGIILWKAVESLTK